MPATQTSDSLLTFMSRRHVRFTKAYLTEYFDKKFLDRVHDNLRRPKQLQDFCRQAEVLRQACRAPLTRKVSKVVTVKKTAARPRLAKLVEQMMAKFEQPIDGVKTIDQARQMEQAQPAQQQVAQDEAIQPKKVLPKPPIAAKPDVRIRKPLILPKSIKDAKIYKPARLQRQNHVEIDSVLPQFGSDLPSSIHPLAQLNQSSSASPPLQHFNSKSFQLIVPQPNESGIEVIQADWNLSNDEIEEVQAIAINLREASSKVFKNLNVIAPHFDIVPGRYKLYKTNWSQHSC